MNEKFVNPYNFIPLTPYKRIVSEKTKTEMKKGSNVGVIEYTLTTKTPVFIPNTSTDSAFKATDEYNGDKKHVSRDFFSYETLSEKETYDDKYYEPVIPGSEIRGMIRNIYETLTNSCMAVLNKDIYPSRRSPETFQPALIKKEGDKSYKLYKAKKSTFTVKNDMLYKAKHDDKKVIYTYEEYCEGQEVELRNDKNMSTKKGYIVKGRKAPKKKYAHVFCLDDNNKICDIGEKDIVRLYEVIYRYQNQTTSEGDEYSEYKNNLEQFIKKGKCGDCFPVYYSFIKDKENDKRLLYMSPASITRKVFNNTIGELAGNFKPCTDKSLLCPACVLFGMTGDSNDNAVASSIRFSDARLSGKAKNNNENYYKDCYGELITLPALSSPKIQNVEFYLKKPKNAIFWNYDYYLTNDGKTKIQNGILRGRKFYWHNPELHYDGQNMSSLKSKFHGQEKTNINITVRPLKQNIEFKGRMYFDGITDEQLQQLVWILNCGSTEENSVGDNDDGKIMYKIGTGKPLGLGSVRLQVEAIKKRSIGIEEEQIVYHNKKQEFVVNNYDDVGYSKEIKEDFLLISTFHEGLRNISYPRKEGDDKGFDWYANNRHGFKEKINQSLPLLSGGKGTSVEDRLKNQEMLCNPQNESKNWQGGKNNRGKNNKYPNKNNKYPHKKNKYNK